MDVGKLVKAIVIFLVGIIEVLLGFRFIFLMIAANSQAEFTRWINSSTDPLIGPFNGVFPSFDLAGIITIELSTLLAMVVYGVFTVVILQLLKAFEGMRVKTGGTQSAVMQQQQPQMPTGQPMMQQMPQQAVQQPMNNQMNGMQNNMNPTTPPSSFGAGQQPNMQNPASNFSPQNNPQPSNPQN